MNFLNKMERQYGRYAIHNLTKYMIGCYAIGYILLYIGQAFDANFFQYLLLSPYHIARTDMENCFMDFDTAFQL